MNTKSNSFKIRVKKLLNPTFNKWWDFQATERYWNIRNLIKNGDFYLRRFLFGTQNKVEQSKSVMARTSYLTQLAIRSFVVAVLLFIILSKTEDIILYFSPSTQEYFIKLTDCILGGAHLQLKSTLDLYTNLMGGIASVSGVFLGLYFTALTTSGGDFINQLSPKLRRLIVTEKNGNMYMQLLTVLTALAFLLWVDAVIFGQISFPAAIFITLFTLVLVAAFYPLGIQSFFLSDPNSISMPLFIEISGNLNKLKKRNNVFIHPAFEKHYRERIVENLTILKGVRELMLSTRSQEYDQTTVLLGNLYNQLLYYLEFKYSIPSDSQWFERVYRHDDWLVIDDTKAKMLDYIGTMPEPTQIPNQEWLENRVIDFSETFLKFYVDKKDIDGVVRVVSLLGQYIAYLSSQWEIDLAIKIYKMIELNCRPFCFNTKVQKIGRFQLAERIDGFLISIIQQSYARVRNANPTEEIKKLSEYVKEDKSELPPNTLPALKPILEQLTKRVRFEKEIEGNVVSEDWYIDQYVAQHYNEQVSVIYKKLSELVKDPQAIKRESETAESAYIKLFGLQRSVELIRRLISHESSYIEFSKKLAQFQKVKDKHLKIEVQSEGRFTQRFEKITDQLFDNMGEVLLLVYEQERDKNLPDFFGMLYYQLCNELFEEIRSNESARFKKLYPHLLTAAFFARNRLLEEYSEYGIDARAKMSLDPILDMMTLGGYAAVYSEYHSNVDLYKTVVESWSKVLPAVMGDTYGRWLISAYDLSRSNFAMSGRGNARFEWSREFREDLIKKQYISGDRHSYKKQCIAPTTPILSILCRHGDEPYEKMNEIFMGVFVLDLGLVEADLKGFKSRFFDELHSRGSFAPDEEDV